MTPEEDRKLERILYLLFWLGSVSCAIGISLQLEKRVVDSWYAMHPVTRCTWHDLAGDTPTTQGETIICQFQGGDLITACWTIPADNNTGDDQ
jgi:hypothetical protein